MKNLVWLFYEEVRDRQRERVRVTEKLERSQKEDVNFGDCTA